MKSKRMKLKKKKSTRKRSPRTKSPRKGSARKKSTERGMKAWLITWEGDVASLGGRCKVASVLSARMNKTEIKFALRVLFFSGNSFNLTDKMVHGTGEGKEAAKWFTKPHSNSSQQFFYGHYPHEYLFARVVKDLHCEMSWQDHREHTLIWIEKDGSWFLPRESVQPAEVPSAEVERRYTYMPKPM